MTITDDTDPIARACQPNKPVTLWMNIAGDLTFLKWFGNPAAALAALSKPLSCPKKSRQVFVLGGPCIGQWTSGI